jgi:hypothetical protein
MKVDERREKVLRILNRRNRYQFGQPSNTTRLVSGGAVACCDTSIQLIVLMALGKRVSLDNVRRRSGARAGAPMSPDQAVRALRSFGLSYEIRRNVLASDVRRLTRQRGPVIMAEMYWSHPQWQDYSYMGKRLTGLARNAFNRSIRVGFARVLKRAGLTQWTFRGGHAVLVATDVRLSGQWLHAVRDSNHNSWTRPERPAFDAVTTYQLNRMLKSWPGGSLVIAPTRAVIR